MKLHELKNVVLYDGRITSICALPSEELERRQKERAQELELQLIERTAREAARAPRPQMRAARVMAATAACCEEFNNLLVKQALKAEREGWGPEIKEGMMRRAARLRKWAKEYRRMAKLATGYVIHEASPTVSDGEQLPVPIVHGVLYPIAVEE